MICAQPHHPAEVTNSDSSAPNASLAPLILPGGAPIVVSAPLGPSARSEGRRRVQIARSFGARSSRLLFLALPLGRGWGGVFNNRHSNLSRRWSSSDLASSRVDSRSRPDRGIVLLGFGPHCRNAL